MKIISMFMLLSIVAACGGKSGGGSSNDQDPARRETMEGERKISLEDFNQEIKTTYINSLNQLYVDQTFEEHSDQLQNVYDQQTGKQTTCKVKTVEKKTVIDFDETTVKIFVERSGEVPAECREFFKLGKSIEVYQKKDLFDANFNSEEIKEIQIYKGTRNGVVLFSFEGSSNNNGIAIKVTGLLNPNISQLYATEKTSITATYEGKIVYSENSRSQKLNDRSARQIDTTGVEVIQVTRE